MTITFGDAQILKGITNVSMVLTTISETGYFTSVLCEKTQL
ncbi:unnamed protein product [Phytomonas sp. EM1]|nr:unnamed protein product [Phytomonas sp. EM1]|eukprot:CCW65830.1 unnamed protein product [Phytomonas sp. isolate EM1]